MKNLVILSVLANQGQQMSNTVIADCPNCNGYGSSLKEEAETCSKCGGLGLVRTTNHTDCRICSYNRELGGIDCSVDDEDTFKNCESFDSIVNYFPSPIKESAMNEENHGFPYPEWMLAATTSDLEN